MSTRRGALLFVGSVLVATCFTQESQAHVGDWLYPIYEISDEDLARIDVQDGSVQDWEEIVGEPSLISANFRSLSTHGDESAAPYDDPSDLVFQIWLGWNRNNHLLLFAYEGFDNYYINQYPGGEIYKILDNDCIAIKIDGDHSGGQYSGLSDANWSEEERKLNRDRTAQTVVAIAEAPDNRSVGYMGTTAGWVNVPPYMDGGGMATGESFAIVVIEFWMTPFNDLLWDSQEGSVLSDLSRGKIIGFDIDVMDHDTEAGDYHGIFSLSGEFDSWRFADLFVDGVLLGVREDFSEDTEVEDGTWGRIKASFR